MREAERTRFEGGEISIALKKYKRNVIFREKRVQMPGTAEVYPKTKKYPIDTCRGAQRLVVVGVVQCTLYTVYTRVHIKRA